MKLIVELTAENLEAFKNLKYLIWKKEGNDFEDLVVPLNLWIRLKNALYMLLDDDE